MVENIPQSIKDNFQITLENIKYPTYPDENFQTIVSDETNLNNYSKEKTHIAFSDFNSLLSRTKQLIYQIISTNMHNFQEYCHNLGEKTMFYVYYFYIIEKYISLIENKYFREPRDDDLLQELFCDQMMLDCLNSGFEFRDVYEKEFKESIDKNKLHSTFKPMIEKYNKLIKDNNEIGNIIIRIIKYSTKYLFTPLEEELQKFFKIKKFYEDDFFKTSINQENEVIILNVIFYLTKIGDLYLALYNGSILGKNDICNLDENSKEWNKLKEIFFRLIPKNIEKIKNIVNEARKNYDLGNSMLSNVNAEDSISTLFFSGIKNFVYYKINENQKKIDSRKFMIKSDIQDSKKLFGMFKKFKGIIKKLIPSIAFRRKIYVKKEYPSINRAYIQKLLNYMKGINIPINNEIDSHKKKEIEDELLPIFFKDKLEDKSIKRNYVSVTILHNEKLYFKDEKEEGLLSPLYKCCMYNEVDIPITNKLKKNVIMIYIHGGGFIGSSTFVHEGHLRKWAKELNIPIFGINYSLAPKYPYPEGLNDIYQAYMWIINHAREELNMSIKHIILSGDSAGGNLALALNNLLICMKEFEQEICKDIILPELLPVYYPATYVNDKNCSNSFILSAMDPILNPKNLQYSCDSYLYNYSLEEDPFVNVLKINDFILDRMTSKIRLFLGSKDTLRDDGVRLLYEFSKYNNKENKKNKIDIRGYDVYYLGHGYNAQNEEFQKISRNLMFPEIEDFIKNL